MRFQINLASTRLVTGVAPKQHVWGMVFLAVLIHFELVDEYLITTFTLNIVCLDLMLFEVLIAFCFISTVPTLVDYFGINWKGNWYSLSCGCYLDYCP